MQYVSIFNPKDSHVRGQAPNMQLNPFASLTRSFPGGIGTVGSAHMRCTGPTEPVSCR